jgi:DNA-binding GntR family transcriptional regulator
VRRENKGNCVNASSAEDEPGDLPGRASDQPRYVQVADELRTAITAGHFAEGDQLPTESALCERHGVSRFTVREALRRLQAEGLIRRRRGSGTIVDTGGQVLRQPLSDVAELLQYAAGSTFEFSVHGRIALSEAQAAEIGIGAGSRWVHLSGVRTLAPGGAAVAVTDVYINPDLEAYVPALRPGHETLFQQLGAAAGFRVVRVEQDIRAVAAGGREASLLGMARRAPVLRIIRIYKDESDRIVEISISAHPGDRFTYSMHSDQV